MSNTPIAALLLIILLLPITILAQKGNSEDKIRLILKDINTKEEIKEIFIEVTLINTEDNEEASFTDYLTTSTLAFNLPEGHDLVIIKADKLTTRGKDYYFYGRLSTPQPMQTAELLMFPVGSAIGTVTDNLKNLVKDAQLKFQCDKDYGDLAPIKTDKFGSFNSKFTPVGKCKIIATYQNTIGIKEVDIKQGELLDIEIVLDKSVTSSASTSALPLIIILFILFIGIFLIYKKFGQETRQETKKGEVKPKKASTQTHPQPKRIHDILNTLNDREKAVIYHLLENRNESTQARIRHHTHIPKTSLSRTLDSLKNKNIINIDSIGKLKKVKLTSWVLEKK